MATESATYVRAADLAGAVAGATSPLAPSLDLNTADLNAPAIIDLPEELVEALRAPDYLLRLTTDDGTVRGEVSYYVRFTPDATIQVEAAAEDGFLVEWLRTSDFLYAGLYDALGTSGMEEPHGDRGEPDAVALGEAMRGELICLHATADRVTGRSVAWLDLGEGDIRLCGDDGSVEPISGRWLSGQLPSLFDRKDR